MIGSTPQIYNVILDSSFAGLVVHGSQCDECKNSMLYQPPTSLNKVSSNPVHFNFDNNGLMFDFGSRVVEGFIFKDRVCLPTLDQDDPKDCLDDFKFIATISPLGLPVDIDGVLGIGPKTQGTLADPFVQYLEDKRIIGYSAVSMYFGEG